MYIRTLTENDFPEALELVGRVFSEFDAPEFTAEGVATFNEFITASNILSMADAGELVLYGAFEENQIVGVLCVKNYSHISLLFVDKSMHRRGIGRALFQYFLEHKKSGPSDITVHSSKYAIPFYESLGFVSLGDLRTDFGMLYMPMTFSPNFT